MHADSIRYIDSLKVETLKLHRPIYGGGGIYPDKFVALDTTEFTNYYRDVTAKGLINTFTIGYVDEHRKEIEKEYKNDINFTRDFQVTPQMLRQLYDMAEKEGIEYNEEEATISAPLFSMILKGLIGRDVFDNSTYYKVYNTHDPIFKEAYRLINSDEYDSLLSTP